MYFSPPVLEEVGEAGGALVSVPLPTIQSKTWLVHKEVREPHLNLLVRMNSLPLALVLKGKSQRSSYEAGGSDVVHEVLRKPVMF